MIKVDVVKQSNYPVSTPKLKNKLAKYLQDNGIVSDAQVNISIVGEKKMIDLAKTYLKEENTVHNVLSFTANEAEDFIYPPDNILYLGEVIVCYPKAFEEARKENKLIDDKVYELVEHGARHLMGKHHN
jgi:rRNA maturation RNase YbeY